ncbi:hypothetical protein G6F56_010946 [Rhizopus delemar]|nr:hypothetical protein G6F56_010946 [Rhizopus delemar]
MIPENTAVEKYFVTRQLPSLETITNSSEDEQIRARLSNMSVRENNPLLKRVMDPSEHQFQRRHSIANIAEPYCLNKTTYSPYSAPSTPPPYQNQTHYFQEDNMRRNSLVTSGRDSNHRIASLILNEEDNAGQRRASTSSISSSSSSLNQQELAARGRYARSPELRASHKMAERKRRQEMKDLFDELKQNLPLEKSLKTSKWEILSKSIDYIEALHHRIYASENELSQLKEELGQLKQNQHIV